MFRNMVTSLFKHDRIRTTGTKAKEIRRWADHLITLAKRGDLHARRQALAIVREKEVVHKLFEQADERFGAVSGGYTRVVKLGIRPGDAAPMSLVELIALQDTKKKKAKKKKTKAVGRPKKKTIDKKSPAGAEDVKADGKKTTAVKAKTEPADKKESIEAEAAKGPVKETADEPSSTETKPAADDPQADKPKKKSKATPKKQAGADEEKDTSDITGKKMTAEKTDEEEK